MVSFWLRKVISQAYRLSGRPLPGPSPKARETRDIAPSLLFKKNFAVHQVLKAGTWQRHTTFTRHYLRDLSRKSLDTFHLGPVVAAQALVWPGLLPGHTYFWLMTDGWLPCLTFSGLPLMYRGKAPVLDKYSTTMLFPCHPCVDTGIMHLNP